MILTKSDILENKRFAIFEPHWDFFTNPSLICLVEELTNCGAHVDIFMQRSENHKPVSENICHYPFPKKPRFWDGDIKNTLKNWKWSSIGWRSRRILKRRKYNLVLGINSEGVIAAFDFSQRKNVSFIYLSFEIFFKNELLKTRDLREKEKEIEASQNAKLVIVQDRWRSRLLSKENGLSVSQIFYLPVAPRAPRSTRKENYLRERFGISREKTIVLHSGSLEEWTYADELLDKVSMWPKDIILVIHTRYLPRKKNKWISKIESGDFENVVLSKQPLEIDEYEEMINSAEIGLVLYKSFSKKKYTGKNIEVIGLSSGKFSYYMKYGLPIISVKQSTYSELLQEYRFGENVDGFDDIVRAIEKIKLNYHFYSNEAKKLFLERLDFDIHWPKLSKRITEILD